MLSAVILFGAALVGTLSAHSMHGFPKASCKEEVGTLCFPHACKNATCDRLPESICLPDRCGCEARFFRWQKESNNFHDVSRLCFATTNIKEAGSFLEKISALDHESISTDLSTHSDITTKTFVSLNLLASEALETIAYFLKQSAEKFPTEENVHRFELATEKLRALQRNRMHFGVRTKVEGSTFDKTDYEAINSIWRTLMEDLKAAIEIGKRMYKVLTEAKHDMKHEVSHETNKITWNDEDTGETMEDESSLEDVVQSDLDMADDLMADEGTFSDIMDIEERANVKVKICLKKKKGKCIKFSKDGGTGSESVPTDAAAADEVDDE